MDTTTQYIVAIFIYILFIAFKSVVNFILEIKRIELILNKENIAQSKFIEDSKKFFENYEYKIVIINGWAYLFKKEEK